MSKAKTETQAKEESRAEDVTEYAKQVHDLWVKVELTRPNVNPSDPLLCTWDLLPDVEKDRYRLLVMSQAPK